MNEKEALKKYFGYDSFKLGQEEIIRAILDGRDVLAVMPTGSGKSVCYQVPALLLPGITVVISPLISLMQDQVKALNEAGIHAGYINSSLTEAQIAKVYAKALEGAFKILYVAPERLESFGFMDFTGRADISMVTVDEAHCISQWGQDFRPSYLKIVDFIQSLRKRPIVSAFTATATGEVRTDIACVLGLRDPKTVVTGFDRENLYFVVETIRQKNDYVREYLRKHPNDSGIIYCATRKNVDSLFELLSEAGIPVARYHAGMGNEDRKISQNDFIFDRIPVMIATNAFGMGIDKSNVRFVIHYNMPQSMENYYQEAGRAGRDGEPSECILLFSPQDIMINKFLLEHKDFSAVQEEDAELIRQRDAKRLQVMEGYCRTTGCLRNYILTYFGEKREEPCQSCGNCHREFTETDRTEEARTVINCVWETKGRYGLNIVLGTLLGANRARLRELGADRYRTYGALKDYSEADLRLLLGELISEGYLIQTEDRYSVIRLGNIEPLRNPETRVLVRTFQSIEPEPGKKSRTKKSTDALTRAGYGLFETLRALRLEIAREESIPPYIIFSDKTLIELSVRVPSDRDSMLRVSGVGEVKYERYGERFLETIDAFLKAHPGSVTGIVDEENPEDAKIVPNGKAPKVPKEKKPKHKAPFSLRPEDAEKYVTREHALLSEIKEELNRITTAENVKVIFGTDIFRLLTEMGYVKEYEEEGRTLQMPTEEGTAKGITTTEKISEKGNPYTVLLYPPEIQKEIAAYYAAREY